MISKKHSSTKHPETGILAVILVGMALLLQFVFFPMGTIHFNGMAYETFPTLVPFCLFLLFIGIVLSAIGMGNWYKTLPVMAFILVGISLLSWVIMFLLGSN